MRSPAVRYTRVSTHYTTDHLYIIRLRFPNRTCIGFTNDVCVCFFRFFFQFFSVFFPGLSLPSPPRPPTNPSTHPSDGNFFFCFSSQIFFVRRTVRRFRRPLTLGRRRRNRHREERCTVHDCPAAIIPVIYPPKSKPRLWSVNLFVFRTYIIVWEKKKKPKKPQQIIKPLLIKTNWHFKSLGLLFFFFL